MDSRILKNPFNITKAVDFSDEEINEYWVDISTGDENLFFDMIKPTSPMPMLILGGKGSGKTHVMRYFSYPLQKIRNNTKVNEWLVADKYIGVYFRCGGMNAGRFTGKGYGAEAWNAVFEYHMELWFSQLLLGIINDYAKLSALNPDVEKEICHEIIQLFDVYDGDVIDSFAGLLSYFNRLQSSLDVVVNNCAIHKNLDEVTISVTRGRLIFGIPKIISQKILEFKDTLFLFLIDEFENLSKDQQKYVQTLLREKEPPSSFKIGARLYGIKTYSTFSAYEKNKEGSEFETLKLDERLRSNKTNYDNFARRLILKRLHENNYRISPSSIAGDELQSLNHIFQEEPEEDFITTITEKIQKKYQDSDRPYFIRLREALSEAKEDKQRQDQIIQLLSCPEYPLLEKINTFQFYKSWKSGENLLASAEKISGNYEQMAKTQKYETLYSSAISHFKNDLIAQLRKDCDSKQIYAGLDSLIDISMGLPRHLLILLKQIFAWASFNGEDIFENPISIKSQQQGIMEASDWFLKETKMIWEEGPKIQDSITRLGRIFKSLRFTDKPSECSLISFSYDPTKISENSKNIIKLAQRWSLLIESGQRKDRNTGASHPRIQLNSLLSPRWDLPIYSRGNIGLSPHEVNAIFDHTFQADFDGVLRERIARMTAPNFGNQNRKTPSITQPTLF